MRVAIVGGRLQGTEAAYLAGKAGWTTLVLDRVNGVPAAGLATEFRQMDVIEVEDWDELLEGIDLVIPALENQNALNVLEMVCQARQVPFLHDSWAYATSSSKIVSNELFRRLSLPVPLPWPNCGFPLIVKPSGLSGSSGVQLISNMAGLNKFKESLSHPNDWVYESYLEGPSYSIEVLGYGGRYLPLQITGLEMDDTFDCKRVVAPIKLSAELKDQFSEIALALAAALGLKGIMDIEAILHNGQLKILEIDARLPSQTPTAVYHSSGVNMLQVLGEAFTGGQSWPALCIEEKQGIIYEHIKVSPNTIEVLGEHVLADCGPLRCQTDFFGAEEALTNYEPGKRDWVATLIVTGSDRPAAWGKRCRVLREIGEEFDVSEWHDRFPKISNVNSGLLELVGR